MSAPTLIDKSVSRLTKNIPVRFQINALTKLGRKELMELLKELFTREGLQKEHVFAIHYALVEVIFNALKANLKFAAFREEIRREFERFKITEIEDFLKMMIEERTLREFMAERVLPETLRTQVRKIFDIEEKYRTGMQQKLTPEQVEILKKYRILVRELQADVTLRMTHSSDEICITVTNSVPILQRDLDRISGSRQKHFELHKKGQAGEFFSYDNMDTTESAGFGIAMVDQGFYKLGLDPFEHLKIKTNSRQTIVTLSYPRRVLQQ